MKPNGQPTPEQIAAANETMAQLIPILRPAVHVMIRGLLASCQNIPAHVVLSGIAWESAHFMGQCFQGDLAQIAIIRAGILAAFKEGMSKAPLPSNEWEPPADQRLGE